MTARQEHDGNSQKTPRRKDDAAINLWVTLRHPVTRHTPSTWMPTQPGVLFFTRALAGSLKAEAN